ncbi:MAG: GerMN domain-containing protein [Clostridiales bacterium]|nr:GerMN domain-containing protein [Clostridiales bacterium]
MKKIYFAAILALIICVAGCFSIPPKSTDDSGEDSKEGPGNKMLKSPGIPVQSSSLEGPVNETTTIVLYFADSNGNLTPKNREVPKVTGIARKTMNELCKGPESPGVSAVMPAETHLLDINIRDGLCTVDFSGELKKNHPGNAVKERLTVYSIVNSLTQFPTVNKVQILVEGEKKETLAGQVNISSPLERNSSILDAH